MRSVQFAVCRHVPPTSAADENPGGVQESQPPSRPDRPRPKERKVGPSTPHARSIGAALRAPAWPPVSAEHPFRGLACTPNHRPARPILRKPSTLSVRTSTLGPAETMATADVKPAKKKNPNRLMVDEASNDDNSVVALNLATMEELQL